MPVTDDEIQHKYLERAIRELNALNHDVQDERPDGAPLAVTGSGHPQADIMLLKYRPTRAEAEEGVAFYGRTGAALLKSFRRLEIDPTTVYGTLCVKWPPPEDPRGDEPPESGTQFVAEELAIVAPRLLVVLGPEALRVLNGLEIPLAQPVHDVPGALQRFTPSCQALVTPSLDEALDEQQRKQAFWTAFREVGTWRDALPPY